MNLYKTLICCLTMSLLLTGCYAMEQLESTRLDQNTPPVSITVPQDTSPVTMPTELSQTVSTEEPEQNTVFLSMPEDLCGIVLDDSTKENILMCYRTAYHQGAEDFICFGQFDDAYAVYVWGNFVVAEAIGRETVAGYTFEYPSLHYMLIYHDGQFYRLADAVNCGVISDQDVKAIFDCITEQDRCPES